MTVVINPGSSGGATTPTTLQSTLVVADHTQMLYRLAMTIGSGLAIIIGQDAGLVSV